MKGASFKSVIQNPSLIPIYACAISGVSLAIFYISRLALRSPDVSYTNKREAEPWNYYRDREYKFFSPSDFNKIKTTPPEY